MNAQPTLYDFRSPNRFSREQFRALQMANETYARQMATVLSTTLRVVAHCSLIKVSQTTYDEYAATLPNPSLLAVLDFHPLQGGGLFQLPMDIVMGVIDRLLGGPGNGDQPIRPLSDIESGLVSRLVQRMIAELTYAYDSLAPIKGTVQSLESDAQFLQLAAPSDPMVDGRLSVITFDPLLEQRLLEYLRVGEAGSYLMLDPLLAERIAVEAARVAQVAEASGQPPVLVCAQPLRLPVRRLLESSTPRTPVLSYAELGGQLTLVTSGVVNVAEVTAA